MMSSSDTCAAFGRPTAQEDDSITLVAGAHDVILDHCSATWSIDEALSLAGDVSNVTVQWCLIAEGLNHSKHTKGSHGYGSLSRAKARSRGITIFGRITTRAIRAWATTMGPPYPTFDVRNNVVYDFGEIASG
jgi:hypothetical protein